MSRGKTDHAIAELIKIVLDNDNSFEMLYIVY